MPRGRANLNADNLRALARTGAEVTLTRIRAEIAAIEIAFPELAIGRVRRTVGRTARAVRRRTWRMSAAGRKAVSERMKRYWAERRKAKAKAK